MVAPLSAYFPLGHETHAEAPINSEVYFPAGHGTHIDKAPCEYILLYVPDGHGEQLV